jgi:mannose-1-phosphate guanylyltransferase
LDHYYAVIMAGGGGTRLWPLSRSARPKQMLQLIDERSLFQTAVERLAGLFPADHIYVVTVDEQATELRAQCPQIPAANFLPEPAPRGTASVVGLAAVALRQRDPQAVMAVLTADHFIGNEDGFRLLLGAAHDVACDGYLVTLGIYPTFAATGFGYIQRGASLGQYQGMDVYHALRFKEKPDDASAHAMLESGDHAWNSGMFVWQVKDVLAEFEKQMPNLARGLHAISLAWDTPARDLVIEKVWDGLKSETIDYGIMEGAQNVAVIPAGGLQWSDVGSWDSLFEVLPGDKDGNIIMGGPYIGVDTRHSLVFASQQPRLIVLIGVDDLVVVDTGDVLMVCRKDQAQKVRQVVQQLKDNGQQYL